MQKVECISQDQTEGHVSNETMHRIIIALLNTTH